MPKSTESQPAGDLQGAIQHTADAIAALGGLHGSVRVTHARSKLLAASEKLNEEIQEQKKAKQS